MNIRERYFTLSGLLLCLFRFLLAQDIVTINIDECQDNKSTLNLTHVSNAIVRAEGNWPPKCDIFLGDSLDESIVISFYQHNLNVNDILVFNDTQGTELWMRGKGRYESGEKSFIFKGPVKIHYETYNSLFSNKIEFGYFMVKFEFVFTVTHDFLCTTDEFECTNRQCIAKHLVCDKQNNCGDRSDEIGCNRPCNEKKFSCNNGKCIDSWKLCNNNDDCGDRSDENNCRECYSWEFRCSNLKCVPKSSVCNNRNDCGDNSDENGCNTAERDNADQRKVTVVDLSNPWVITIIVCAAVLTIVIATIAEIYIRNRMNKKKKPPTTQLSNVPTNTNNQNVQPLNLFGHIRHSFRSGGQSAPCSIQPSGQIQQPHAVSRPQPHQAPSVYPQIQSTVEYSDVHQMPPRNIVERVRQSFRSGHQSAPSSIQSPGPTEPPAVASGEQPYQVPSMYPNLQPGVDNPVFRAEV